MSVFAERLKSIRKSRGVSQKELADALGVSASTVSMYECGSREPSVPLIERICTALDVSPSELFGFEGVTRRELKLALFKNTDVPDGILDEVLRFADYLSTRKAAK